MMNFAKERLKEKGFTEVVLWVLEENHRTALKFPPKGIPFVIPLFMGRCPKPRKLLKKLGQNFKYCDEGSRCILGAY